MSKKDLYKATDLEGLAKYYNIPDLKHKKTKMLCKTAEKVLDQAEHCHLLGDEEESYVKYMKYLNIIQVIRESSEYKANKEYFNMMLDNKSICKAIDRAEELNKSLAERYKRLQNGPDLVHKVNEPQVKITQKTSVEATKPKEIKNKGSSAESLGHVTTNLTLSCTELYDLIKDRIKNILVMDTRPATDFQASHMIYENCISIPREIIVPGTSASRLAQLLPEESKPLWSKRDVVDLIVMMDWRESNVKAPDTTLHTLYNIMQKWDPNVTYKRFPVALFGGYADWMLAYPTLCTDPRQAPPTQIDSLDDLLDDVDYPAFHDISDTLSPKQNGVGNNATPGVDRNSKVAALQVYGKNVTKLLNQQEKNVDTSILLEHQRLEAEQQWEKTRLRREREAEEEMRAELQERERHLLYSILQMESSQKDKLMENKMLRQQLEEYKRKEREQAMMHKDKAISQSDAVEVERTAAQRIQEKERERQKLNKQREDLAKEREKKLAEARSLKKDLKKYEDQSMSSYSVTLKEEPTDSSGLKRAHSTPNIAQLADKLDNSIKHNVAPKFDRTAKPTPRPLFDYDSIRQRDFGAEKGALGRGLTGLKNLGNTCYMNSILQCLNNTSKLTQYFCDGTYREHVNRNNETKGRIADEMAAVVQALWSSQYRFIAIKDLRSVIGQHMKRFQGNEQQDSHEFLTILIEWLHSDLQINIRNPEKVRDNLPPAEKSWQEYTKSKVSIIRSLFSGQIKSTVRCLVCGKESLTYDAFSHLSLELPAKQERCTLSDCLNLYSNSEKVSEWSCTSCNAKRDAMKKLDISMLPPILIIHFKRFHNPYHKEQTYIDFPIENLNINPYLVQDQKNHAVSNGLYNLYGVSNHYGDIESGHYTAYCKSSVYGKWYKFDDHMVTPMDPNDVKSSAAYILFYSNHSDNTTKDSR